MARRSASATRADYLLVGGLALVCFVLVIMVLHRSQSSTQPAPLVAPTATPQSQIPAATQAAPTTVMGFQPPTAIAAPSQAVAMGGSDATQPTPSAATPDGTASVPMPLPTMPAYRKNQNM